MKFLVSFLITFFCISVAQAQESRVLVQNSKGTTSEKPIVNIKWYNQQFIYKKGVNVYRREVGGAWVKLNTTPVIMAQSVSPALLQRDEDLQAFLDMAKELTAAEEDGFVLLTLFGKSFQSQDYAKLIGIQFDDITAEWGKNYEYRVAKIESTGKETELGISSSLRVGYYAPSAAVQDYKIVLDKDIAKMTWKAEEDRFYGVNIYRNLRTDTSWIRLNPTPVVQSEADGGPEADVMFADDSLQQGMILNYKIAGLDFFGEETLLSEKVEVKVGDFTPPLPPRNLAKKVNVLDVTITWEIQQVKDLAGFNVYRSNSSDGPFTKVSDKLVGEADTAFIDHVPQPAFYYYYVAAVDESGNEANSFTIMAEVQDVIPPLPPSNVIAKADTGKVVLTWANNSEADIMGYYVFRAINESKEPKFVLINSEPLREATYTQVLAGNASNKFLFKLVAVDTSYNRSQPSTIVSARLLDVTAPIKPVIKNISVKGDSIIVSWLPNPEADLKGFILSRLKEGDAKPVVIGRDKILSTAKVYEDTVTAAGKYYYQLQAIDESGNLSELSEVFPVTRSAVFRFTFGEIKAKYKKRKRAVTLNWSASSAPLGYTVFRKSDNDLTWKPVSGLIATQNYDDNSVSKKLIYSYQIRAYSSSGEVAISSSVNIRTKK